MIKTVIIALSGVIATASPAFADTARDVVAPVVIGASTATQVQAPDAKPQSSKVRYCVSDLITGSRIARKVCQTRDQWLRQGFDPLVKD